MRAAIIDPSLFTIPYDGALCDALRSAGCDVAFYGRPMRPAEMLAGRTPLQPFFYKLSERLHARLPVGAVRVAKGVEHAFDMLRLRRTFQEQPPDVIHFQWAPLPVVDKHMVASLRALAPTVLTVHDPTPYNGSSNTAVQKIGAAEILPAFDHLIVHTEAARAQLRRQGIVPSRISVIPHGIIVPPGSSAGRRGEDQAGDLILLLFGKIKTYKGADLLIEAFAGLDESLRRRTRVRIVGEPFMPIEPLKARAAELGVADRLIWDARYVRDDEIDTIMSSADVLVFPYREIDTSGVLLMSFRYGKPIVASAIGAFAELLRDGVHGRLVPPGNVAALTAALADVLADGERRRQMGDALHKLAEDAVPSWDDIARRTIALYHRLLASRRVAA